MFPEHQISISERMLNDHVTSNDAEIKYVLNDNSFCNCIFY